MSNFYSGQSVDSPAIRAEVVSPSDSTNLARVSRGIWVGGAGNVAAVMLGGDVVTITGVPAGTLLPIRVTRINSTNTTATNMVAFD